MSFFKWVIWVLIGLAVLLIITGGLCFIFKFEMGGINLISYFHAASSLLLLAIAIHLATDKCCEKK